MKSINYIIVFLLLGFCWRFSAQERPPINIFGPEDYYGGSQNWSISQAEDRTIFVTNNLGLLEYNGSKWTLYESPNETIVRAVRVIDNLVYTGSYHDFGYWKRDSFGVLNYTSLADELKVTFLEDEEFWNILSLDNWILFQSLDRIHIYNKDTKSHSVINSKTVISKLFNVGENFYFQNRNSGLYKIENGTDVLVSSDEVIKNNLITNIFGNVNELLILTQDAGFYKLINGNLVPWNIPANAILRDVSVFSGIRLEDKSFVLGTISNGIIHMAPEGELTYKISQSNGLSNNTVLSLHEDADNNIWLGLDNGINCINLKSSYRLYFDKNGRIGSVYTSEVFNGMLYLGTNQGLFCKPLESEEDFVFINGTQGQVWFLDVLKDTLFCGHNSGTFIVEGKSAKKIAEVSGTWLIKEINGHSDLLLQGNYNGLNILEDRNGNWQFRNKIEGFNISSRYFEFLNDDEIFLSHEYKGVFRLKMDRDFTKVVTNEHKEIVQNKLYSSLIKYQNEMLYATRKGIFKFNRTTDRFEKDSLLSNLISEDNYTSAKLVPELETDRLWSFSSDGINYVTASKLSGEKRIDRIPFPVEIRQDVTGFEDITHIGNQRFLLGSKTGYAIFDLDNLSDHKSEIKINQVAVRKLKGNDSINLVNLNEKPNLENNENTLKFSYSISEFLKNQKPLYRYKLEGIYDTWSDWTSEGEVLFENLPFGDYNFVVNGKVGNQPTLNTASFSFSISRPWFLSNGAILVYILLLLLFSLFMHNIYKRYYRKQRERLMLKTTREFELKELENKQQLMRFRNEKLREDIENKNRELGISTMNLIKKNEFLSTIKKELEGAKDNDRSIKQVIKIIDRNLNNNDDWNLFQEAFNNADKDFLKKIKSMHPALTANDLRLCAYLRLNLSSKEIAPLLNISPRSVEVKRYRLRKKMGLSHEASLSNYILEI